MHSIFRWINDVMHFFFHRFAAAVFALMCVAIAPMASFAQVQEPPKEFTPLDQLPPTEPLPAAQLLIAAYAVVLVVLFNVFIININTATGIREVPAGPKEMARSVETSRIDMYRKVILPWASPHIITGLRHRHMKRHDGVRGEIIHDAVFQLPAQLRGFEDDHALRHEFKGRIGKVDFIGIDRGLGRETDFLCAA